MEAFVLQLIVCLRGGKTSAIKGLFTMPPRTVRTAVSCTVLAQVVLSDAYYKHATQDISHDGGQRPVIHIYGDNPQVS